MFDSNRKPRYKIKVRNNQSKKIGRKWIDTTQN